MTRTETAIALFSEGFHCSQAVLAAFSEEFGISREHALRLGSCLGSGMRKGEVCGACTGALMTLGLKYGQYIAGDAASRTASNEVTDRFLAEFARENGSYICNELLGYDVTTAEGLEHVRRNNLFVDFCPKMVASAVRITEAIMEEGGTCAVGPEEKHESL